MPVSPVRAVTSVLGSPFKPESRRPVEDVTFFNRWSQDVRVAEVDAGAPAHNPQKGPLKPTPAK